MFFNLAMCGRGVIPTTSARRPSIPIMRTFFLDRAVSQLLLASFNTVRRSNTSKSVSSGVLHVGNCVEVVVEATVVPVVVVVVDVVVVVVVVVGGVQDGTSHKLHLLLGSVV